MRCLLARPFSLAPASWSPPGPRRLPAGPCVTSITMFCRSTHRYEVVEAGDFRCVALVRQVPEVAAAGDEDAEGPAAQRGEPAVPASRAEASANVEPRRHVHPGSAGAAAGVTFGFGDRGSGAGSLEQGHEAAGLARLQEAAAAGTLEALLALGVPPLEAGERRRHAYRLVRSPRPAWRHG